MKERKKCYKKKSLKFPLSVRSSGAEAAHLRRRAKRSSAASDMTRLHTLKMRLLQHALHDALVRFAAPPLRSGSGPPGPLPERSGYWPHFLKGFLFLEFLENPESNLIKIHQSSPGYTSPRCFEKKLYIFDLVFLIYRLF